MKRNKVMWAVSIAITAVCAVLIFLLLQDSSPTTLQADNVVPVQSDDTAAAALQTQSVYPRETSGPASEPAAADQTSTPKPDPSPVHIIFTESRELLLPRLNEKLQYGQRFYLSGKIESTEPLTGVTATIYPEGAEDTTPVQQAEVAFSASDNVKTYDLDDAESPSGGSSVNDLMSFDLLEAGWYTLEISASTEKAEDIYLVSSDFVVGEPSEWLQLTSNNFRYNYSYAAAFFGKPDRFLFKYKWGNGRNIITDPKWVRKYITSFKGVNGENWKVHIDAVPYFEKAVDYLENTYVRVRGNGHDSGVIRLSRLIKSFNGAYYSRFVTDKSFISHHAFGTALDLNASIKPNNNVIENHGIIWHEVNDCLVYNGIMKDGKKSYYDFTYTGSWQERYRDIPTSLLNYLLYELAFFRAGFGWGYYYSHTCDAMHFTLSERDIMEHSDTDTGLRKVYEYN